MPRPAKKVAKKRDRLFDQKKPAPRTRKSPVPSSVHVVNIVDPDALREALKSPEASKRIMDVIRSGPRLGKEYREPCRAKFSDLNQVTNFGGFPTIPVDETPETILAERDHLRERFARLEKDHLALVDKEMFARHRVRDLEKDLSNALAGVRVLAEREP